MHKNSDAHTASPKKTTKSILTATKVPPEVNTAQTEGTRHRHHASQGVVELSVQALEGVG